MKPLKHLLYVCMAVCTVVTVCTACNDEDSTIDYTEYYAWRDKNNALTDRIDNLLLKDADYGTYFDHRVESLAEPGHYSYWHVVRPGADRSPANRPYANSTLKVHYTLYKTKSVMDKLPADDLKMRDTEYLDGIFFDSDHKADTLQSMQVQYFENFKPNTGVIKGWGDILQQMYVGDSFVIYVPWYLAYGQAGKDDIEPYTGLFFRLELVAITYQGGTQPPLLEE